MAASEGRRRGAGENSGAIGGPKSRDRRSFRTGGLVRRYPLSPLHPTLGPGRAAETGRHTLRDWVHRFNASGLEGLVDNWTEGPKPRLSAEQLAQFAQIVEAGPDRGKDVVVRWRRPRPQARHRREVGRRLSSYVVLREESGGA